MRSPAPGRGARGRKRVREPRYRPNRPNRPNRRRRRRNPSPGGPRLNQRVCTGSGQGRQGRQGRGRVKGRCVERPSPARPTAKVQERGGAGRVQAAKGPSELGVHRGGLELHRRALGQIWNAHDEQRERAIESVVSACFCPSLPHRRRRRCSCRSSGRSENQRVVIARALLLFVRVAAFGPNQSHEASGAGRAPQVKRQRGHRRAQPHGERSRNARPETKRPEARGPDTKGGVFFGSATRAAMQAAAKC